MGPERYRTTTRASRVMFTVYYRFIDQATFTRASQSG